MGRKPISKQEKLTRGTFRKDREPLPKLIFQPLDHLPEPPIWFSVLAKKIYQEAALELLKRRHLQKIGIPLLQMYCHYIASSIDIEKEAREKTGISIAEKKLLGQMSRAYAEQARKVANEFGLTPLSHLRIGVNLPESGGNENLNDQDFSGT